MSRRRLARPASFAVVRSRRGRFLSVALVVTAVSLGVAACGGASPNAGVASVGTTTSTTSGSTNGGGSPAAQFHEAVRYSSCMRSHGVSKFPEPADHGASRSLKVTKSAIVSTPHFATGARDCARYATAGSTVPTLTSRDRTDYLRAAACMRSHGVTAFPDPVFTGGRVSFPIPSAIDPNSTSFRQARAVCERLVPPGLPYNSQAGNGQ